MNAGSPETWISDEPRFSSMARLVFRRAARRPVRVLLVTALITAAVVGSWARRTPTYLATLDLRLVEGDVVDPLRTPRPPRALLEYIYLVALSRSRVERIMKEHQWSSAWLATDPVMAIDQFRFEDIVVEVSQNFFLYDRRARDAPRSATVSIRLRGTDPQKTRAVLREIGEEIRDEQEAYRTMRLEQAQKALDGQLTAARERLRLLQGRIARLESAVRARERTDGVGWPEIVALTNEVPSAIRQVLALERRASETRFNAAAERAKLGLSFELFDESLVAEPPVLSVRQLALRGAGVFAIALLLVIVVLGAFDDRIYDPADLEARGLPLFGALHRFPGDDTGSYGARGSSGHV
jgi:hypothetical protein